MENHRNINSLNRLIVERFITGSKIREIEEGYKSDFKHHGIKDAQKYIFDMVKELEPHSNTANVLKSNSFMPKESFSNNEDDYGKTELTFTETDYIPPSTEKCDLSFSERLGLTLSML